MHVFGFIVGTIYSMYEYLHFAPLISVYGAVSAFIKVQKKSCYFSDGNKSVNKDINKSRIE